MSSESNLFANHDYGNRVALYSPALYHDARPLGECLYLHCLINWVDVYVFSDFASVIVRYSCSMRSKTIDNTKQLKKVKYI